MSKPRSFVRMFMPRFASMVLSGEKTQTVRPVPKRMPSVGDRISLRRWEGKPYRSEQIVLREATISHVDPIELAPERFVVAGRQLTPEEARAFAQADGFNSPHDLLEWFYVTHTLPFAGILIRWELDKS